MSMLSKLNKYEEVGIDSSVHSADAHKLVLLLYQGALLSIAAARNHLMNNEVGAKGKSISQAISIIEEGLMASLNLSVGGELVQNLSALYAYMSARLLEANLRNEVAMLDEVSRLLIELRGGWEAIRPGETEAAPHPSAAAREKVVTLNARGNEGVSAGVRQALNAYQQI
ncbi:flagellar export chaperone FliS [Ferrovum myxofaciens]|uniref:flagellar export chaperone FliS n=1 Tax=Ferrovum myxofaciens TaxID=416213 RepID=UPI0023540B82|nr:flagellar export chaperone FliS [Ferrovum myxofaciens]MBU6994720.1 flagellar export chaperone FliS [Ferrovum myxofaciens]